MEKIDIRHDIKTFAFLGEKVIQYQHQALFLYVCQSLQTVLKVLQTNEMRWIGVTDNIFLEGWKSILKEAELTLMH